MWMASRTLGAYEDDWEGPEAEPEASAAGTVAVDDDDDVPWVRRSTG